MYLIDSLLNHVEACLLVVVEDDDAAVHGVPSELTQHYEVVVVRARVHHISEESLLCSS